MSRIFPHVVFTDLNPAVRDALESAFRGWSSGSSDVEVPLPQDFRLALPADAVVSPANSFGLMDGGFDAALTKHFGNIVQERAQARIASVYSGDQPVGTAFEVHTDDPNCPFVIHAPTMRYPADISATTNVYYAFKAVMELASQRQYKRVVCPGLGTLSGKMDPQVAAAQMEGAYATVRVAWNRQYGPDTPAPLTQAQKWDIAQQIEHMVERLRAPGAVKPHLVVPEFVARHRSVDGHDVPVVR